MSDFVGRWKYPLMILALLAVPTYLALHTEVRAGFHISSLAPTTREFCLNITIFSGGSEVVAGEFNVSYPSEFTRLVKVEGGKEWVVVPAGQRYLFYTLSGAPNETVVAVLHFELNEQVQRGFNITLEYFKAADSTGKDLDVVLDPAVVSVTPTTGGGSAGGGIVEVGTGAENYRGWILVTAIAVAASIIVISLYLRTQALPGYYLLDHQGRILFSGRRRDYVYGREDFVGLIPPQQLGYITRRSKGGQFRIFVQDGTYYIEDNYSKNPTLVDGASIRGKGPVPLRDGCSISLPGVFHLIFRRVGRR